MSESLQLRGSGGVHRIEVTEREVVIDGAAIPAVRKPDGSVTVGGELRRNAWTAASGDIRWVFLEGEVFIFEVERAASKRRRSALAQGSLEAPMPATVRKIAVEQGASVRHGDVLIVLEAMKMELPVRAPADGTVAAIKCTEGEMVQAGQELIELRSADQP